ncbi:PREDICTED: pheromone-binding protein Gp-9-like isoform X2 [Wasmannia auropunctata]|uniref:pheromone-binding protein Gp-9-like isoform X2 n=1 Tax=Wasmannia auropunctata TaxID=64793 RepID=UPI0005F00E01|nr:PREDICTED: pheromone-binding protein Gp-9-like isoform X2 [Wasmannia auropunctata]
MSKTDVQICFNKTNVNLNLMMMDQLVNDEVQTASINNSALKVSCLFACLLQKKGLMVGTNINVERMKEEMDNKSHLNTKDIAVRNNILDICIDRVKSKTNECDVILKLVLCVIAETKRYHKSIIR